MQVCWQLTGSRKDAWAAANPFEVEQEKPEEERGRFLEPRLEDYRQVRDELRRLEEEQRREMEELRRRREQQEEAPPEST
jgi:hypothetical protein